MVAELTDLIGEIGDARGGLRVGSPQGGRCNLHYLPANEEYDSEGLPMRMAYWAEYPIVDK